MKRMPVLLVAVALLSAGAGHGALAAKAPKPLVKTLYLHGSSAYGNQDTAAGDGLTMDATKPTGSTTKEIAMVGGNAAGALVVPKPCPGGPYIPAWTSTVSGTLKGSVTVRFYARGTGGNVTVQLLADPTDCNEDLVPAAQVLAAVPQSPTAALVTAVLPLPAKGLKVGQALWVQFLTDQTTTAPPGAFGLTGLSYDSTAAPSAVTFTCLPKTGKKTC